MSEPVSDENISRAIEWLDSVSRGANTMSRRNLSNIEKYGGIDRVKKLAEERGVHLVRLEDDKGNELVAASVKPFKVIC